MGRVDLGLSEAEWGRLTPRLLVTLLNRRAELERRAGIRGAGLIAATIVNMTPRKKGARVAQPTDFFPEPRKPQSMEEMGRVLDALVARQARAVPLKSRPR